jgi:hypothetical protein
VVESHRKEEVKAEPEWLKIKEATMCRRAYPSDVSDEEWAILEPLIPPAKPGGRPRTTDMREVLNALFYLDRTAGQWRALPHDFPPWSTVWSYFRTWPSEWHLGAHPYHASRTGAGEAGPRADS